MRQAEALPLLQQVVLPLDLHQVRLQEVLKILANLHRLPFR
jgi:hypothetical protein